MVQLQKHKQRLLDQPIFLLETYDFIGYRQHIIVWLKI